MTRTLTTKVLNDFIAGQGYGVAPSAVEAMARELLANREAQPVSGECNKEVYENGQSACLVDIPKETAEVICRGISQATGCKLDWHYIGGRVHIKAIAPAAPAVPEAISTRQAIANMERHELCGSINVAYKHGWNDFRAAILAQPVSQGYKLDSLNIRAVAALREAVRNQWLKSNEFADKVYWHNMHSIANEIIEAMAAAPEGGK